MYVFTLRQRILKCSVKSYVTGPSTKCCFNKFLFMWVLTHDKIGLLTVVSVRSAMVSWYSVKSTSKRWFLKIVQVTMKRDPFYVMKKSMQTLQLCCIHLLCWSLEHSVKRTWTGSAFNTNESLKCNGHGLSVSRVKWS